MNYLDLNEFCKRKRRIKIIIIYLFVFVYIVYIKYFTIQKDLRVCLCSPTKKENRYLKEFVEHYKGYNLDKIYLYDNNDIEGEHLEDVIEDYIKSGLVEIVNFRGKIRALYDMMNDCYKNHYFNYDWLIFYEIDEYIHLHNYKDIKKFLNKDIFNKCVTIQLNWLFHTDNDKIYYENKPLKIRFPNSNKKVKFPAVKSILKGKII